MKIVDIFGFHIVKNDLSIIPLDKKVLVNTVSPNSYGLAVKDQVMNDALKNSDFLVLDGLYFGLAPLLLKKQLVKRFSGWDCFRYFSKKVNEVHGEVFFLGSSKETLDKIQNKYINDYPFAQVETYSPPFKDTFLEEDLDVMRSKINEFEPDVVFVGMTAPKQEKWGYQNKEFLKTHVICAIGNVFDWYAGNSKRPGKFWQKVGLEWLVRIFYRPEIFKRNIKNQMLYFWHLFLFVLNIKKYD